MMGGGPKKDKKFVRKMMRQIKAGAKEIFVVNDKFGTPTYTHDFAKNTLELLQSQNWGLYNMVCEGLTSRLDVVKELLKILDLETKITLNEVGSDFFKNEYFAARPLSERLVNKKLKLRKLDMMRDWRESLREYIDTEYVNYLN
jgi:dTDP-4-dehydrorhamnose reductase